MSASADMTTAADIYPGEGWFEVSPVQLEAYSGTHALRIVEQLDSGTTVLYDIENFTIACPWTRTESQSVTVRDGAGAIVYSAGILDNFRVFLQPHSAQTVFHRHLPQIASRVLGLSLHRVTPADLRGLLGLIDVHLTSLDLSDEECLTILRDVRDHVADLIAASAAES